MKKKSVVTCAVLVLAACTPETERGVVYEYDYDLQSVLYSDSLATLVLGRDQTSELTVFSSVARAATNRSGSRYVIVDRAFPAVRVFDEGGQLLFAVGARGEGPGEMNTVQSVAVADDGAVAVLHDYMRLSVFGATGELIVSEAVGDMRPLAIAPSCAASSASWLIYGPSPGQPDDGVSQWLHRVQVDLDSLVWESSLELRGAHSEGVRRGGPHGLLVSADGWITVHHEFADTTKVVQARCGDWLSVNQSPVLAREASASGASTASEVEPAGQVSLGSDTRIRRGAAVIGDGLVLATSVIVSVEPPQRETFITFIDDDGNHLGRIVAGAWTFHGSTWDGRVLVSTSEGIPRLLVIDEETILSELVD